MKNSSRKSTKSINKRVILLGTLMGKKGIFIERHLNEEQEKLLRDDIKLVYKTYHSLRKSFLVKNEEEDLISEGYIGLIYAASNYKPELGYSFSTYAMPVIKSKMFHYLKKNGPFYGNIQGEDAICVDKDGDSLTLFDIMEDTSLPIEKMDSLIDANLLVSTLKADERHILEKFNAGYTYEDIARDIGKKRSYIYSVLRSVRKKLRRRLEKENTNPRKATVVGSGKYYISVDGQYKPINRLTNWKGATKKENNENNKSN